ncbi:MAG: DUF2029 domain-containing protein [Acidobacteria bacterium]|nr:DUF2029 domain-containing protein [Acidobacteriota bacterium]
MEADRRGELARRLQAAYDRWTAVAFSRHAAAIGLLVLFLAAVYAPWLLSPEPLGDELVYVRAFHAVAAGRPPTTSGDYLYFPVLALAGARLEEALGPFPVLLALRGLNLLGLATALWLSLAWIPIRWRWRLAAAAALGALAPTYRLGMTYDNLSLASAGMVLAGLLFWSRRPWLCGSLLGLSIAVKPIAPVAVGLLATHRPERTERTGPLPWAHRWAAGTAFLLSCLLFFGFPYFRDTLAYARPRLAARSLSWHRLPHILGFEIDPLLLFVLLAFLFFLFVRSRELSPWLFLAVALTGTLAATPLVWSHTLLLSLPIQALSLQVAWWRRQERKKEGMHFRAVERFEPMLVLLAVLALQFSEGAT